MSKTKISEFSSDPALNTDIDGINIAEGCAPSGINNAIRELMAQLKDWQSGTSLDTFNTNYMVATAVDINGGAIDGAVIGANSAAAATFTTATATTFNATTVDSTSIEVTNIKAKDGTAAATIADSTGKVTISTELAVDNLNLSTNTLSTTNTNGNLVLSANGTGQVVVSSSLRLPSGVYDAGNNVIFTASGGVMSITNNPILSGGTANGVLYLNGSKAATSGSALTFDGTNLGVNTTPLGGGRISTIGDFSSVNGVVIQDSATTYANNDWYLLLRNSSNNSIAGLSHPAANSLGIWGNDDIRFLITGSQTEQMRLTSTGLGIGTTSPAAILATTKSSATQATGLLLRNPDGTNGSSISIDFETSSGTSGQEATLAGRISGVRVNSGTTGALDFFTTNSGTLGSAKMRLDSSGNLGLGVTPSAWDAGYKAIQIASGQPTALMGAGNQTELVTNAYYGSAAWRYVGSSVAASRYGQESGVHKWFNAPSGTAGNAITFTQAMTLNASGNLGIGTSSPVAKLDVRSAGTYTGEPQGIFYDTRSMAANVGGGINFGGSYTGTTVTTWAGISGLKENATDGNFAGALAFYTRPNGLGSTERMRIDSSGNLLVGVTSNPSGARLLVRSDTAQVRIGHATNSRYRSDYYMDASGTTSINAYDDTGGVYLPITIASSVLAISRGAAETARFDSSGNLLVGTTSSNGRLTVNGNAGGVNSVHVIQDTAGGYSFVSDAANNGGTYYHMRFLQAGNQVGSITSSGSTTAYNTSSDYRLKENIAPMTGALDKVAALKPCTYTWKVDGSAGEGFIAHELAEVVPQCVTGEKDAVDADGNPQYQGIDTSFLVATLTAAIQEQQAIIESLKSRLDAAGL